jgi:hypothetical protein
MSVDAPMTPSQFPIKNPAADAAGLISLFFIKEVTADSMLGYRNIIVLDLDLVVFIIVVLLASKSLLCSLCATECSYTSLGHSN